ncbi:MAG TPA: response regulator [bacterium]|nr:response regulator [bacterium]
MQPNKPRVLAIDDEEVIGYLIQRIGSMLGFEVDWVSDGVLALQKIERETYDVILSDFRLPKMSGESLYQEIARQNPEMLTRLIFMTGDTLNQQVIHFFDRCRIPFLIKPFDVDELHQIISRLSARLPA